MADFDGVTPALGQALTKRGYAELTPVQNAVLAPELKDADMLVSAQTGSGKTVAFGIALAPNLLGDDKGFGLVDAPLALVVAPTRELAMQVKREFEWLYETTDAAIASCVGGMDPRTERRALGRRPHIVVGTPGRLRDHIERGSLDLSILKAVVLDEADEMLDLGFREDLEFILDASPVERRTLMFSATVPRTIANLAKRYQRDAVRVTTTAEKSQHLDIEYRALTIAHNDQENAIVNVLRYFDAKTALVFCGTRATVNHMTSRFNNRGFSVVALSGELSQNERTHALQAIRDGRARVCIATDVAARGIDLPNLDLVVHADLPRNGQSLLHRSGRTGRAGRKGVSVLIVPKSWRTRTERLLQSAKIQATWGNPPSAAEIVERDDLRLLEDPTLIQPLKEEESSFAQQLLAKHDAEQIAAAFVRLYRAGQSAPEELRDPGPAPEERKKKQTDNFKNGVWISLSVGRQQNAEVRRLLAMLCRHGDVSSRQIGAIRIHQNETHVELEPNCVEHFLAAIGPDNTIEKTITLSRLEGTPEAPQDSYKGNFQPRPKRARRDTTPKPYEKKKPYEKNKPRTDAEPDRPAQPERQERPKRPKQPERSERPAKTEPKARVSNDADTPREDKKPWNKTNKKTWDKTKKKPWDKTEKKPKKSKDHKKGKAHGSKFAAKSAGKFDPRSAGTSPKDGKPSGGRSPLRLKKPKKAD
jgi:ATP-dependent RNA helicase DeaD